MTFANSLWKYQDLLHELTVREVKARYKQSILGYGWVILNPFVQMVVMAFVFSAVLKISIPNTPYPLFLYLGLLPWIFVSNSIQTAASSLVANSSLIKKIYFPRELFVASTILAKTIDFLLSCVVVTIFFIGYQRMPGSVALFLVPMMIFFQLLIAYGIGLFVAAANLFFRDVQYLISLIILVWFYLTPVMYPDTIVPTKYLFWFQLNPMTLIITGYRQSLLHNQMLEWWQLAYLLVVSVFILISGWWFFHHTEKYFADIV